MGNLLPFILRLTERQIGDYGWEYTSADFLVVTETKETALGKALMLYKSTSASDWSFIDVTASAADGAAFCEIDDDFEPFN
jgi:hypothetical protein